MISNNNLFCNIKCNVILYMDRLRILNFPIKIMSYSIVMVAGGITLFILLFIISFPLMISKAKFILAFVNIFNCIIKNYSRRSYITNCIGHINNSIAKLFEYCCHFLCYLYVDFLLPLSRISLCKSVFTIKFVLTKLCWQNYQELLHILYDQYIRGILTYTDYL